MIASEAIVAPWQPGLLDAAYSSVGAGDEWEVVSGSSDRALSLVDGLHDATAGLAHYSRQTPGSPTFTGNGADLVLVTKNGLAVWSVIESRLNGSEEWRFRNQVFRRVGGGRASDLIRSAVDATRREWLRKYGQPPRARLTTEIDAAKVRHKRDPGRCYLRAGWRFIGLTKSGLLRFQAPEAGE